MRIGSLTLSEPVVMGILNITPDSFSDGGRFRSRDVALRHAEAMLAEGARILDIGGESTRPGAVAVSENEEIDRVLPLIDALIGITDAPISIDTSKPAVMRAAVEAGAALINDVRALREPGALEAAAELPAAICLMHMQGEPRTMQQAPEYSDVTADIAAFLRERQDACIAAGIDNRRLLLDPGFGFGKTAVHNMELLANLRQLHALGRPLLVGLSRKSTLGAITGRDVDRRVAASVAAAAIAVERGAMIIRAHDVAANVDALRIAQAVMEAGTS